MCLLLAPPGSGKSTLLKVLSGKIQDGGLLKVSAPSPFAWLPGHLCFRGLVGHACSGQTCQVGSTCCASFPGVLREQAHACSSLYGASRSCRRGAQGSSGLPAWKSVPWREGTTSSTVSMCARRLGATSHTMGKPSMTSSSRGRQAMSSRTINTTPPCEYGLVCCRTTLLPSILSCPGVQSPTLSLVLLGDCCISTPSAMRLCTKRVLL